MEACVGVGAGVGHRANRRNRISNRPSPEALAMKMKIAAKPGASAFYLPGFG